MKMQIDYDSIEINNGEKALIERNTQFLLSRIGNLVHSIKVIIIDANGHRGELVKQCTVTIKGKLFAPVIIEESQRSAIVAAKNALRRADQAFMRKYKRKQLFKSKRLFKTHFRRDNLEYLS